MKLNFRKEYLKESFQKIVTIIGLFILVIILIKGGENISQQNISTIIMPETNTKTIEIIKEDNPYQLAYNKCTHPKMSLEFENKCVAWELKNNEVKK